MRPVVYIAGPYTNGDCVANTRTAMDMWHVLFDMGFAPICPHWSMFQHFLTPLGYEDWLDYDFALIDKCDFLLRIEGESSGADREIKHAHYRRIPVAYSLGELVELRKLRFPD